MMCHDNTIKACVDRGFPKEELDMHEAISSGHIKIVK